MSSSIRPLCELHVHLYGCIRSRSLLRHLASCDKIPNWDWYESEFEAVYGFVPPTRGLVERYRSGDASVVEEFSALGVVTDSDAGSFARFQAKGRLSWVATDHSSERFEQEVLGFVADIRSDFAAQEVAYVEQRTFPTGPPFLLEAFAHDAGPPVQRAVATLPRDDPKPAWDGLQKTLLGPLGKVVVAIDFSGVEEGYPPRQLSELFSEVRAFNDLHPDRAVAILDHVGETFVDKSLESAIRWVQEAAELGVHRLGHAIALGIDPAAFGEHARTEAVQERRDQIAYDITHADELRGAGVRVDVDRLVAEDSELASRDADDLLNISYDADRLCEVRMRQDVAMARVQATGAVIEVCPTSNRRIGGIADPAHHPIHRFLAKGLPIVVSTDDPGTFDITLHDELDWVVEVTQRDELRHELIDAAWRSRSEILSGRMAE